MFRRLFTVAALFCVIGASAEIRWLSTEYDFGSFKEAEGKRTGMVQFVNEGTEPTIIQRVKPTCGCTVARYTEDVIAPGDTATVWMEYNPAGRPGRFEKHVKVYTGEQGEMTSITIRGTVIGAPSTLASSYPLEFGPLRLSSSHIKLGDVTYGLSRHEYIHGYNQGSDTIALSWDRLSPALSIGVSSKKIAPGDLFTLSVYFNTRDQGEIGSVEMPVNMNVADTSGTQEVPLMVTANIKPDTSKFTEQELRDAPSIMAWPTVVDLGQTEAAKKPLPFVFSIKNEGKNTLAISRIHAPGTQEILKIKSFSSKLKPGKVSEVKGELDLSEISSGPYSVDVEIVSNDPLHPAKRIRIVGTKLQAP